MFSSHLDHLVRQALFEDLSGGDLTSEATIPENARAIVEAVAKSPLVLSGSEVFARCFYQAAPGSRVQQMTVEGTLALPGQILLRAEGSARGLLMAERTALNFLQRLSGTATLTRKFVDIAAGRVRVVDTRKTTPGLRALERAAVRDGGGHNHRDCLGSAVLIKDNHIAASGGITAAVKAAQSYAPHTSRIEVEVTTLAEVAEALDAHADILLLDNFEEAAAKEAISLAKGRAMIEISGNVTLDRMDALSALGPDVISVGALTHSAPAADISLRLLPVEQGAPGLIRE